MEATGGDWLGWLGWLGVPAALVLLWLLSRLLSDPGTAPEDERDLREPRARDEARASSAPARRATDPLQADLLELLRAGKKLEAIKRWRELTGLGLAEAKAAVEALERGEQVPLPAGPPPGTPARDLPPPPPAPASLADVEALLRAGRKIEAIKVHRELTGLGLRESKQAVEALEARLRG